MQESSYKDPPLLFVTGLSGAGKTFVLKILEDNAYRTIDNMPLDAMVAYLPNATKDGHLIAASTNIRTLGFSADIFVEKVIKPYVDKKGYPLLFLDADDAALLRRYKESRRVHPYDQNEDVIISLPQAIKMEREALAPILDKATHVIDTTDMSVRRLREIVLDMFPTHYNGRSAITVYSFAYRYGLPREADFVFDMRFLQNPYYEGHLRDLSGRCKEVEAYLESQASGVVFFGHIKAMLEDLILQLQTAQRTYLTLAFGCTGGFHRSVYSAEKICAWIKQMGIPVNLIHRDLEKSAPTFIKDEDRLAYR